jgi:hypothetical protein
MLIIELCDDLLEIISNETKKHRAVATITRAWRERARLLRLQNWDWETENEKLIPRQSTYKDRHSCTGSCSDDARNAPNRSPRTHRTRQNDP